MKKSSKPSGTPSLLEDLKNSLDPKRITKQQVLAGILVLILVGIVFYASDFALNLPPEFIRTYGLAGVFALSIIGTMTIILPIPIDASIFMLSQAYPPGLIALIAGIGSGIGEMTAYALGYFGHKVTDHHEFEMAKKRIGKYGYVFVFLTAIMPIPLPYDIVGIAGGYLGLKFLPFLGATMAGKVIRYYIISRTGNWFFNGNH